MMGAKVHITTETDKYFKPTPKLIAKKIGCRETSDFKSNYFKLIYSNKSKYYNSDFRPMIGHSFSCLQI
jgi:hypothetical protein